MFLEKAIKLNPLLIEAYLSLTAITFKHTRDIKAILKIYDNMPSELATNDLLIQQKSALFLSSGNFDEGIKIANMISDKDLRNQFLNKTK